VSTASVPARLHTRARPPLVVVMGVSGSGKSTVGAALATRLDLDFADGDAFHSGANVAKMAAGRSLDDDDRAPWLHAIGAWLAAHDRSGGVISCSALRRTYRDTLRAAAGRVFFLHLQGDASVVAQRVNSRPGHFMPATLLQSQLESLEPLDPNELGVALDLSSPVRSIVDASIFALGASAPSP